MDWNIFFSTVSQTSGAIVGIFAAFLITRVITSQTDFNRNKERLITLLQDSKKLTEEASTRYFKWYNKSVADSSLGELESKYEKDKELLTAEEYYNLFVFSPFQKKSESLDVIQEKINELVKTERKRKEEVTQFGFPLSLPMPNSLTRSSSFIPIGVQEERESIDNLLVRISYQETKNNDFLREIKSGNETSSLTKYSIIAVFLLFFCGVIYPLSFLPIPVGAEIKLSISVGWAILWSPKGVMLSIISIIFAGLMITFYVVNQSLKYDTKQIEKLKKYSQRTNYSQYIKNYEENIARTKKSTEPPLSTPQEMQEAS